MQAEEDKELSNKQKLLLAALLVGAAGTGAVGGSLLSRGRENSIIPPAPQESAISKLMKRPEVPAGLAGVGGGLVGAFGPSAAGEGLQNLALKLIDKRVDDRILRGLRDSGKALTAIPKSVGGALGALGAAIPTYMYMSRKKAQ